MKTPLLKHDGSFRFSDLQEVYRQRANGSGPKNLWSLRKMILSLRHPKGQKPAKILRKQKEAQGRITDEQILESLSQVVWVSVVVANYFQIELQREFFIYFPDHCTYCYAAPCWCLKRPPDQKPPRRLAAMLPNWWQERSFAETQEMMWTIYPKDLNREGLLGLLCHFYEEVLELLLELDPDPKGGVHNVTLIQGELCDFLEKVFDLATIVENLSGRKGSFAKHTARLFNSSKTYTAR